MQSIPSERQLKAKVQDWVNGLNQRKLALSSIQNKEPLNERLDDLYTFLYHFKLDLVPDIDTSLLINTLACTYLNRKTLQRIKPYWSNELIKKVNELLPNDNNDYYVLLSYNTSYETISNDIIHPVEYGVFNWDSLYDINNTHLIINKLTNVYDNPNIDAVKSANLVLDEFIQMTFNNLIHMVINMINKKYKTSLKPHQYFLPLYY